MIITDIAGEDDVRNALGQAGDRLPQRDDARKHGAATPCSTDAEALSRRVGRGDPPLASTSAGPIWLTISRTVPTRAPLTVREITRLSTASSPVIKFRLVRITTSLSASFCRNR